MKYLLKILKFLLYLAIAIIILAAFFYVIFRPPDKVEWGLTFSGEEASYLGLDPKGAYLEILDGLKPKSVRLMAYWETIEKKPGEFDFSAIDFNLEENQKRGIKTLLVVGYKQPRWPECHAPGWLENLSEAQKEQAILNYVYAAVEHFKIFSSIEMWQVENEPFFPYGGKNCLPVKKALLVKEMAIVRKLDRRPILLTDSGEKSVWLKTAGQGAEAFGSTMYREVKNDKANKYQTYLLPPSFYRIKAGVLKVFFGYNKVAGVELQAEPWFSGNVWDMPWDEQQTHMNPEIFKNNIKYAKKTGFYIHYLWGAEWWLWAKAQGHSEMWEAAKGLFTNNQ